MTASYSSRYVWLLLLSCESKDAAYLWSLECYCVWVVCLNVCVCVCVWARNVL